MEYMFSVVMGIYNVESCLREAIDSLVSQDIGFENIQLILVDDGSPDGCGTICDEYAAQYPNNILVIHKENGGVSSAWNAGLTRAKGRYINFMDPADRVDPDLFSKVYLFFEENSDRTDVVSVPVRFFDGRTGEHPLNTKYRSGSRVIDLDKEWNAIQIHLNSSFIRTAALVGLSFDERLHYAGGANLLQRVLINERTLGCMADARYNCRVRDGSESSALQKQTTDPNWYLPRLEHYFLDIIDFCRGKAGAVPKYVQFSLMYEIQEFLLMTGLPEGVLTPEEEAEAISHVFSVIKQIDDDVIMAQRDIKIEQKLFALRIKYDTIPELRHTAEDLEYCYAGKQLYSASKRVPRITFIRFEDGMCTVEGRLSLFSLPGIEQGVRAELDGVPLCCEVTDDTKCLFSLGEPVLIFYDFRVTFPAPEHGSRLLRICAGIDGQTIVLHTYTFSGFSGLSEIYHSSYYYHCGWCVRQDDGLRVSRSGRLQHAKSEVRFLWELLTSKKHRARKAVLYRIGCRLLRVFRRRPLWMISDRENRAGDNGEALFRYLAAEHPEIDARFILLENSPEWAALSAIGRVVPADSLHRKLLCLSSDYVISSQIDPLNIRPFFPKDEPYRDLMADYRFVFLQHGVIKDDLSEWLKRSNENIFGFVTSAKPEYDSILHGRYGYTEKEIWLTGLPRFDRLEMGSTPRQITIMPTWRRYLMGSADPRTSEWSLSPQFFSSEYYAFYTALLNDERLMRAAKLYGYRIAFFPHPTLQPHVSVFARNEDVVVLGLDTAYRDVFSKSALVVTDYSSAVFDFVYMRRPVLYTQFDRDRFYSGEHVYTQGYFDYDRDGFGEVELDLDHTVERIIEYMAGGCQMKDKYRTRADRFFAFNDRNNCQRVYNKLMENGASSDY